MSSQAAAKYLRPVALSAIILALGAGLLHATELSRSTAVTIVPFALCLGAASGYAYWSGRWPRRVWVVSFIALAALALAYSAWLCVYGLTHPPVAF